MSIIEGQPYTPETINQIRFRIPLYQRPYSWGNMQVEQLLKDLLSQFLKNPAHKYFIGILNIGKTIYNDEFFDLIDGQQRITTLALIGKVMENYHRNWSSFLDNRLDLYGRFEDQQYLKKLEISLNTNSRMINAIKLIESFIDTKIENQKVEFSEYVYKYAAFFLSEVPQEYSITDRNLHFVRMNNRGKQLEAPDVLKIKLASYINAQNDFISKWNKISQLGCNDDDSEILENKSLSDLLNSEVRFEDPQKESEIFYQSILSFPEFLLIALERFFRKEGININVSHTKEKKVSEFRKDKLLEEFGFGEKTIDFIWKENYVHSFMSVMEKQFGLYDRFIIKRDKADKYKFSQKYKENLIGDSLLELQAFQSFLYASREPYQHNWLIEAFDYLENHIENEQIETGSFLKKLKFIDNSRFENSDSFSFCYPEIDRYWFWRLDYYLWENRKNYFKEKRSIELADKYIFRINRSIEHVAPQNPEYDSNIRLKDELLNSFGNLTMISSGQNSSLQNKSFQVKHAHIESFINGSKSGSVESLKMLKIYEFPMWNEDYVIQHNNEMIEVLMDSYNNENSMENKLKTFLLNRNI